MSFSLIVENHRLLWASRSKFCEWRRPPPGQGYKTPLGGGILWVHRQQSTWGDRAPRAEERSEYIRRNPPFLGVLKWAKEVR